MALTCVPREHTFRAFKGNAIPEQSWRTECCVYNQQCIELRLTKVNY